jgi:hypothetical protein
MFPPVSGSRLAGVKPERQVNADAAKTDANLALQMAELQGAPETLRELGLPRRSGRSLLLDASQDNAI